ncbi:acyltransferase [Clostridium chromiireducens]|uniref:Putative acetyltransferase n=1 Tax=Clostridium chromiireducens TaxID=225345 RepID=A0A1V4J019_9CLOT|nr:acyltransferase [Clostridium chromiireducens]OPJ65365.1 putative acetyltransferase [Clostridium chromiireducens]
MKIMDKAMKIVGKENFKLDRRIGISYIIRLCWSYGWMMIRGRIISFFSKSISSSIFVGRGVKLYEKRYLQVGNKAKIHDDCEIDALSTDGVIIGDSVVLGKRTIIQCTGGLQKIGKGVRIGDRTTFGSDCFFGAAGGIEIGNDVVAGQYIRFHSENHYYDDMTQLIREQGVTNKGIKIGDNCWIGAGAVFLDGVKVGNGCVIGANTLVNKDLPHNSVAVGNPIRIIRIRGNE